MAEPDGSGVPERVISLLRMYIDARARRDLAEEEMADLRRTIGTLYGEDSLSVALDDVRVTYEMRAGNSRPNVAALRAAGYRPEQFCATKPSMTALRALAEQEQWDESRIDGFTIKSAERRPMITVKSIESEEGEAYGAQ